MVKSRLKLAIWLILLGCTLATLYAVLVGLGQVITYFHNGADPASALTLIPTVPDDLPDRLTWLDDHVSASEGRALPDFTRQQLAGAYLHAWAQWGISYELQRPYITSTVSAGWQIQQSNLHHTLQLTFYSDDGLVATFTDQAAQLVQQVSRADDGVDEINETTSVYDVVMILEEGNWRVHDLVRRSGGPTLAVPAPDKPAPVGFVRVQGRALQLDGKPYALAGINYYPQTSPWTKFWPEYRATTTRADLKLIRQLGLNTVRIFIAYTDFGGDKVDPVNLAKLKDFLDQAQANELKVIVTLFDHHTDHHLSAWSADDRHLAGLIPAVATHPAILAWDIKNEANRDYGLNTPALTNAWLRHIANTVHRYDPYHLLTIGWSTPEAATAMTNTVDFISFHYFEDSTAYGERLARLLAAAPDKPVILQEFVMSTWNSFWPNGHTEEEQAIYYADLLRQHRNQPTAGYLVWTLHDFDSVPLAEFSLPWQQATQAHMGLIRRDGSLKPAAALIRPGASLVVAPLPRWQRFTKPFWQMVFGGSALVLLGWLIWAGRRWLRRRAR
ncbi:MAG: cellulase family glycosylhydrolase [Chloroflexi bacterium]|nr:cellulase family glycosylhydrolase [Chloroflexota bacterium]